MQLANRGTFPLTGPNTIWVKNSVFEKNFVVGRFQRRDWARAFKLGGMIRYIWGSGLLKKNSWFSDFCENYGHFSKLDFTIFFKLSIWHQHDQFMHYSTWPMYRLFTLKEFFRLSNFWGENSFFKKKTVMGWFWRRDWTRALQPVEMVSKQWTYRGVIDFEGIFQIGSFLGKK